MDSQINSTPSGTEGFSLVMYQGEGGYVLGFASAMSHSQLFDVGDISRNCTEDGWSEPFPHYYDACGFDENETESDNQVRINLMIKKK